MRDVGNLAPFYYLSHRCIMAEHVHVEEVELQGHILDSLLLPKVLDVILTHGGNYVIKDIRIGQGQADPSRARIAVRADTSARLEEILSIIHDHGAIAVHDTDCEILAADMAGAFPEGFYCTTNFRTQVRLGEEWIEVEDQEMDCGIIVDSQGVAARCIPMTMVCKGDRIVAGQGNPRFSAGDPTTHRPF